jgi:hypothetical protein
MSGVILNTKDDAAFQVAWTGTRRTIAKERTIRRVSPIMGTVSEGRRGR